jgi:ribosomal protein L44E
MREYIDDGYYCDICEAYTRQQVHDAEHERDSSGDWRRCLVCKGYYSGYTGKWEEITDTTGD